MADGKRDQPGTESAKIGLALAADIEQVAMKGYRYGEAGKDEIGWVVECIADRFWIAESAVSED